MVPKQNWIERLAEGMDLVGEPLPGQPVVELLGEHRILIEHHFGVTQYCTDKVCVKVAYGTVTVSGNCLEIRRMTKEQLVIIGRIDQINLHRRCR